MLKNLAVNMHTRENPVENPVAARRPKIAPTQIHFHVSKCHCWIIYLFASLPSKYDHRLNTRTGYPVRSGIHNLEIG